MRKNNPTLSTITESEVRNHQNIYNMLFNKRITLTDHGMMLPQDHPQPAFITEEFASIPLFHFANTGHLFKMNGDLCKASGPPGGDQFFAAPLSHCK